MKNTHMQSHLPKILFICYDGYRTTNARVRCYHFSEQLRQRLGKIALATIYDKYSLLNIGEMLSKILKKNEDV